MILSQAAKADGEQAWPRLLADIGGTHARFGWQAREDAEIVQVHVLLCAQHAGPVEAVRAYLAQTGLPMPACAAFAMANPVTGDAVRMTNLAWHFSLDQVRQQLGLRCLLLVNDFTALALALPTLPAEHRHSIGPGRALEGAAIGLIGPGTGLGVSGLIPAIGSSAWAPVVGEGGHVTLSPANEREWRVVEWLQRHHGHASAERALCGAGLCDLLRAIAELRGLAMTHAPTPAQVLEQALHAPDSLEDEAVELFCAFLGSVAGDLALTLGARGGVYIGGGVVPRMRERFARSAFRARFEAKGRFAGYLQDVPTWVIDAPVSQALRGASVALSACL